MNAVRLLYALIEPLNCALTVRTSISNCMHGDRGNPKIVVLMLAVCVVLHAVVIPVWMWSLGL